MSSYEHFLIRMRILNICDDNVIQLHYQCSYVNARKLFSNLRLLRLIFRIIKFRSQNKQKIIIIILVIVEFSNVKSF